MEEPDCLLGVALPSSCKHVKHFVMRRRERTKRMGEAGRTRVKELFSNDAFANRLDQVLKNVVFKNKK
jgi:hypothetical protein